MPNGNPFLDALDALDPDDGQGFIATPPVEIDNQLVRSQPPVSANPFLASFDQARGAFDRKQDEDKTMGVLAWLAEASGIPSVFRTAVRVVPGEEGRKLRDVTGVTPAGTASDAVVAGITLLGGVGLRGAVKLIRGVAKGVFDPLINVSPKALRETLRTLDKPITDVVGHSGGLVAAAEREFGEQALPFSLGEAQDAIKVAIELAKSGRSIYDDPVVKNLNQRLFKQLGKAYEMGDVDIDIIPRLMHDMGITSNDEGAIAFARMFEMAATESARTLKLLSDLKKLLGKSFSGAESQALDEIFAQQGISHILGLPKFRDLTNVWRASITAQLATSIRNFEVSAGLLTPLRFVDDIMTGAAQRFTGATGVPVSVADAAENFTAIGRMFRGGLGKGKGVAFSSKNAELLEQAMSKVDQFQTTRLFGTPVFDVLDSGAGPGVTQKIVNYLQIANRTQEKIARAIIFDAEFAKRLSPLGIDPADFWKVGFGGPWGQGQAQVLREALRDSVTKALDLTFAGQPTGALGKWLIQSYRQFPALALVHPFPRFLANSMKFLRDHSPFGLARYMTKNQRRAIVQGILSGGAPETLGVNITREATEAIGKAMSGYVLFSGAIATRELWGGERWYELKVGDRIVDMRPFNPLAAYLLLAEQMRRTADPSITGTEISGRDYAEAFAGIRRFQGTGLFIFNLFDQDVDQFTKGIKSTAAEMVGGFTIPFRTIKDFMATVKEDEGVFRGKDAGGLLGPALSNLPLLGAALQPEIPRETREGKVGEEPPVGPLATPTFRQLTGLITRTRTDVEAELLNQNINVRPRTGDPDLDRKISEEIGDRIDRRLSRIIASPSYQRMNSVRKRDRLSKEITRIKSAAKRRILRRDRQEIIANIMSELEGLGRDRQLRELRKMRNSGRIDKRLESVIAARLRRRG